MRGYDRIAVVLEQGLLVHRDEEFVFRQKNGLFILCVHGALLCLFRVSGGARQETHRRVASIGVPDRYCPDSIPGREIKQC